MRVDFTSIWIFWGWIAPFILHLCTQGVLSKPTCNEANQYGRYNKCCSKCEPGRYVFMECTASADTICRRCGQDEYQPDWNQDKKCLPQKYCDPGKGFAPDRRVNPLAPEPCRCKPGLQCSPINCEFCIKKCQPGFELEVDRLGLDSCKLCSYGYFSNNSTTGRCQPWTDCRALGKIEERPGTEKTDSVCGALIPGSTLWVVVAVLSTFVIISLVILFLFCYKEKLKLLSENLRTCVQNLKQTRIQQETLVQPCNTSNGPPSCPLYEITYVINCKDTWADSTTQPPAQEPTESSISTGESSPSLGSSSCMLSQREPQEVGENEDCSQVVAIQCCQATKGMGTAPCTNCCPIESVDQTLLEDCRQNEPLCCSVDSTTAPLMSPVCVQGVCLHVQTVEHQQRCAP